jgi:hypothetical protein
MAQIPNANAQTVSDGSLVFWNIDTLNKHAQLTNADFSLTQSATAPVIAGAGTITTAGVGVARVAPSAARTGIILQVGTQPGQIVLVVNQSAAGNSLTFDVSGTSNVADGTSDVIPGLQARLYAWDSITSLWYPVGNPFNWGVLAISASSPGGIGINTGVNAADAVVIDPGADTTKGLVVFAHSGTQSTTLLEVEDNSFNPVFTVDKAGSVISLGGLSIGQSASAPVIAGAGTIATAGLGVSRVAPSAARTGIIMQPGTVAGQMCWVVNQSAAANTLTFDVSGTSNVAGGVNDMIPGLQARLYVWDSVTSLWYATPQVANVVSLTQSGSAPAIAGNGTITTAAVGVARVSPAGAVTGIILQAGTVAGQMVLVVNEAVQGNSLTFNTTLATANVADSANCSPIDGLSSRLFIWDSGTSLWYAQSQLVGGSVAPLQSATAVAIANSGAIATANIGVSRLNPASAVTAITMAAGTYPGQMCLVVNEAAQGNTITFNTTAATAKVADSANCSPIDGLSSRLFVWDSSTSLWYAQSQLTAGAVVSQMSATAVATLDNGTVATAGIGVSRVSPAGNRTGCILAAGTYGAQEVWVVNESSANTISWATQATSHIAGEAGGTYVLAAKSAQKFVYDSSTSLWYKG